MEQKEKAIFIRSFKTKRADGHSIRTVYALTETGVVNIERRIVSTELNEGFVLIRKFGKYIYQLERMVFKLESFIQISSTVSLHIPKLEIDKIMRVDDVKYKPNEKTVVKIEL
jgi:adenine/guanine phosphoribosyltransferase-like PRPP-binding protein